MSHGLSEPDRRRIVEITVAIVSGMVAKGEVDPEDDDALRAATKRASEDARAAYLAALEYVRG